MMDKFFNHVEEEKELLKLWDEKRVSKFKGNFAKKYLHVLPPPNANGTLHVGHASGYTYMDIMARYRRMNGRDVLLIPGKDHAGIQTQVVFEKKIEKELGKTRYDLGREEFYKQCYDFCMDRASYMRGQEKALGLSADFEKEKFTLDPEVSKIVRETFVQMYEDGIIYRGNRLINWCSRCRTALSDLEVEHDLEKGNIWDIRYPLAEDASQSITVATTRPETMLGDTAVAVHPEDERYQKWIGREVVLPIVGRRIPIVADARVEKDFGSGAVKITPAHDPLDYEIGKDHKLPTISVIGEDGKMTAEAGADYAGLSTLEAREKVVAKLSELGVLGDIKTLDHNVSKCERCRSTVESLVSLQWFINVDHEKFSLKQKAIEAIKNNEIAIYPNRFAPVFVAWLENLHDWCISRQLWWGHRIPVFYCDSCKKEFVSAEEKPTCVCGGTARQDEDTLDTWFSSGQWPYTTIGFKNNPDFEKLYPTDFMLMGRDIMMFWAIRMLMMSLYRTGMVPFKALYLSGLVLDKEGRKMSKSKGNVISPLDMMEKYGSDALRFSYVIGSSAGQDFRMSEEKIGGYRNFINKIWNATRFVISKYGEKEIPKFETVPPAKTVYDKWMFDSLQDLIDEERIALEQYDFNRAGTALYEFIWFTYCDWYLEVNKGENENLEMLVYVLAQLLKLLHPMVPFITESVWQKLYNGDVLALATYPTAAPRVYGKEKETVNEIFAIVSAIRAMKAQLGIAKGGNVILKGKYISSAALLSDIKMLAGIDEIVIGENTLQSFIKQSTSNTEIFFEVSKEQQTALAAAQQKEIAELTAGIARTEKLLDNANFVKNAKPEIVAGEQKKIADWKARLAKLQK